MNPRHHDYAVTRRPMGDVIIVLPDLTACLLTHQQNVACGIAPPAQALTVDGSPRRTQVRQEDEHQLVRQGNLQLLYPYSPVVAIQEAHVPLSPVSRVMHVANWAFSKPLQILQLDDAQSDMCLGKDPSASPPPRRCMMAKSAAKQLPASNWTGFATGMCCVETANIPVPTMNMHTPTHNLPLTLNCGARSNSSTRGRLRALDDMMNTVAGLRNPTITR